MYTYKLLTKFESIADIIEYKRFDYRRQKKFNYFTGLLLSDLKLRVENFYRLNTLTPKYNYFVSQLTKQCLRLFTIREKQLFFVFV